MDDAVIDVFMILIGLKFFVLSVRISRQQKSARSFSIFFLVIMKMHHSETAERDLLVEAD
jgi:hypothetical protein